MELKISGGIMNIQEQIKNLSDKELLEKYKNKDEYFQNVQELLEKEVSERVQSNRTETNNKSWWTRSQNGGRIFSG